MRDSALPMGRAESFQALSTGSIPVARFPSRSITQGNAHGNEALPPPSLRKGSHTERARTSVGRAACSGPGFETAPNSSAGLPPSSSRWFGRRESEMLSRFA